MFVFTRGRISATGTYVLILLVAFRLHHSLCAEETTPRWWGFTRFITVTGAPCVTPCRQTGGSEHFECYIAQHWELGAYSWCSPEVGVDYTGRKCKSRCQYSWNQGYWCWTDDQGNWNSCGNTLPGPESQTPTTRFMTTRGELCLSPCERAGKSYKWCMNSKSWDYCSDQPDHDYYGKKCKDPCNFHGYSYTWCTLQDGSWNYCGTTIQNPKVEFTCSGSKCISQCEYSDALKWNLCEDASLRQNGEALTKCSREPGKSANNLDCTGTCAPDGGSGGIHKIYNWCWTNPEKTEWFQCSKVGNNLE